MRFVIILQLFCSMFLTYVKFLSIFFLSVLPFTIFVALFVVKSHSEIVLLKVLLYGHWSLVTGRIGRIKIWISKKITIDWFKFIFFRLNAKFERKFSLMFLFTLFFKLNFSLFTLFSLNSKIYQMF